jgi:hypothetical protein
MWFDSDASSVEQCPPGKPISLCYGSSLFAYDGALLAQGSEMISAASDARKAKEAPVGQRIVRVARVNWLGCLVRSSRFREQLQA